MTNATYTQLLASSGPLESKFNPAEMVLDQENFNSQAVSFDDEATLGRLSFVGENMTHDGAWTITGGDVHSLIFRLDWQPYFTIEGLNTSVTRLHDVMADRGISGLMAFVLKGNDTMKGSRAGDTIDAGGGNDVLKGGGGADVLVGGKGGDTLTGGLGSDEFVFDSHSGSDVITDFDARGARQDHLLLPDNETYHIHTSGSDLVLNFSHGHSLTLDDVKPSDFGAANVHFSHLS